MTDLLDETRRKIADRMKELKAAVDEYDRLKAAESALANAGAATPAAATANSAPRRRGPGRPRRSVSPVSNDGPAATPVKAARKKPGRPPGRKKVGRPPGKVGRPAGRPKGRVGRRKGSGTRAAQALSLVQGQPGITIPELAAKMSINQNYLYRGVTTNA